MAEAKPITTADAPNLLGGAPAKRLNWDPRPDITTHELALAQPVLTAMAGGRMTQIDIGHMAAALPENVRRHFRIG